MTCKRSDQLDDGVSNLRSEDTGEDQYRLGVQKTHLDLCIIKRLVFYTSLVSSDAFDSNKSLATGKERRVRG